MAIILNNPVEIKTPQVASEYIWDRDARKLIKKEVDKPQSVPVVSVKKEVIKPEITRNKLPLKQKNSLPDHYIKVEDGSLHKFYNTKSQYLKDMAALDNL